MSTCRGQYSIPGGLAEMKVLGPSWKIWTFYLLQSIKKVQLRTREVLHHLDGDKEPSHLLWVSSWSELLCPPGLHLFSSWSPPCLLLVPPSRWLIRSFPLLLCLHVQLPAAGVRCKTLLFCCELIHSENNITKVTLHKPACCCCCCCCQASSTIR